MIPRALRLASFAVLAVACARGIAGTSRAETRPIDVEHARPAETKRNAAVVRQWGLTPDEYARYKTLMAGVRGAFSAPNISPLEVLGIHARTPEERRRYADRLVRLMYEDTERVLAFEREVQAAWRRLGEPMFDPDLAGAPMIPGPALAAALGGRRLAAFVAAEGCPSCAAQVRALASRTDLPGLDIYVTDTDDPDVIRAFARSAGVPPEAVRKGRITLNRGAALLALYEGPPPRLPALFVRVGDRLLALGPAGRTGTAEGGRRR